MSVLPLTASSVSANDPAVMVLDSVAQAHSVDAHNSTFNNVQDHSSQHNYEVHGSQTVNNYHQPFAQERQELADWLSPLNFYQTQNDAYESRCSETGEWILDDEKFKEWRKGDKKTLWCPGIPGAGKTVLASYIIDYLKKNKDDTVAVIYIYCNYRDTARQTPHHLISSLLKQLVQEFPSTFENVKSEFKSHRERHFTPTLHEIQNTLIAEIKKFSQVFVVVDALDEIPEDGDARGKLLRILQSLGTNLLVTSREITTVGTTLHEAPRLDIRARDSDMRKYIEEHLLGRLGRLVAKYPDLKEEVIECIIKSAQGMFLLCCLHINSLVCHITPRDLRIALKNLPKELDSAYDETMKRIESQAEHLSLLAITAIMWIVHARRLLRVKELQEVLAFLPGVHEINDNDLVDETEIIEICAGLVVIDVPDIGYGKNPVFRLVHYSTQEYFNKYPKWPFPNPQVEITRVSLETFSRPPIHHYHPIYGWRIDPALSQYATANWGHHARGSVEETNMAMIEGFMNHKQRVLQALSVTTESLSAVSAGSALHLCAFFGLDRTVALLLKNGTTADQQGVNGETPLHIAAEQGHATTATLLLDRGANVNASDNSGSTPLSLAAKSGKIEVVKMLLGRDNVEADSRDNSGRSPLSLAAEEGNVEAVKMFLARNDVEADSRDNDGRSPLSFATFGRNTKAVQMLLARDDVEADSRTNDGRSPLSFAAFWGNTKAMQMLLAREDVDADSRTNYGRSPLSFAAKFGNIDAIKMLLARDDVEADSRTNYGRSPLSFAAENPFSHVEAIQILLARDDVEADSRTKYGQSPLSFAAFQGYTKAMQILLARNDVEVDSRTSDGRSPLSLVAERGNVEAMQMLLAKDDVDADSRTNAGRSPLSFAAERGNVDVMKMLLARNGVEADSRTNYGQSPLSFAAAAGNVHAMQMLLTRDDVEADSRTVDGRSPFSFAAERGNVDVMKMLLARDVEADSRTIDGNSPLSCAALQGNVEAMQMLLARNDVEADSRTNYDRSPLSWSALGGNVEAMKILLTREDVDANSKDQYSRTPFSFAIDSFHRPDSSLEVARLFLDSEGFDVNSQDGDGMTLLMRAAASNIPELVKMIFAHCGQDVSINLQDSKGWTALVHAAAIQHTSAGLTKELLARKDIETEIKDNDGRTAFMHAANSGCMTMAEHLLQKDDVAINERDKNGLSPLMLAATGNHAEMLRLLLSHKDIQIHSKNNGLTPLMYAAAAGAVDSMKQLLSCQHVDINATNDGGRTALMLATISKKVDAVKFLLAQNGVELNKRDNEGQTLLMCAMAGQAEIAETRQKSIQPRGWEVWPKPSIEDPKDILRFLLSRDDFTVNSSDIITCMPLAFSLEHAYDAELAQLLLKYVPDSFDMNWKDECGPIPLWLAAWHGDKKTVEFLLTLDQVDLNAVPKNRKMPPLSAAASRILDEVLDEKSVDVSGDTSESGMTYWWSQEWEARTYWHNQDPEDIVNISGVEPVIRLLLARPEVNVNWRNDHDRTLLFIAAKNGHQFLVKALLGRHDIDVNSQDENGDSPLHIAVRFGRKIIVSLLLKRDDVAINLKNAVGQTPLHCAVILSGITSHRVLAHKQEVMTKLLLARSDIHPDLEDDDGSTPLMVARSVGAVRVVKLLEDYATVWESCRIERDGAQVEFKELPQISSDVRDHSISDGSESYYTCDDTSDSR